MSLQDAVKPVQEVTLSELAADFIDHISVVAWGVAGAEADNKIQVQLGIINPKQEAVTVAERLRLTCSGSATMALKGAGVGTVLSGSGTADMIIETDVATGHFDLEVTDAVAETITIASGPTQGSGVVNCQATKDLVFA